MLTSTRLCEAALWNGAEGQAAKDADASSAQQQADEQSWWHGYFMRAGRLGAIRRVKPSEAKVQSALRTEIFQGQ